MEFSHVSFSEATFEGTLENTKFYYCNLRGSDFKNVELRNCSFVYSDLSNCEFRGAIFSNTTIVACNTDTAVGIPFELLDNYDGNPVIRPSWVERQFLAQKQNPYVVALAFPLVVAALLSLVVMVGMRELWSGFVRKLTFWA